MGDCLWYIALLGNTLGYNIETLCEFNINKLKERYPEKFDEELAKEENRDRDAEMRKIRAQDDGPD